MKKINANHFQKYVVISAVIVIVVLCWAGLTKSGAIPNFLDIEVLCSSSNANDYDEDPTPIFNPYPKYPISYKPVIYLYPTSPTDVKVELNYQGQLFATYPSYDNDIKGWQVTAYPDGKLINKTDSKEYSYLFWEGKSSAEYDLSTGFVVKGSDTREFLQEKLAYLGLTPKEYNEFIVFWYPQMKDNSYNLIKFAEEEYTDTAPLAITPTPDSILRVFMVFKPLDKPIVVQPQSLASFERKGFSVIEWGGTEIE